MLKKHITLIMMTVFIFVQIVAAVPASAEDMEDDSDQWGIGGEGHYEYYYPVASDVSMLPGESFLIPRVFFGYAEDAVYPSGAIIPAAFDSAGVMISEGNVDCVSITEAAEGWIVTANDSGAAMITLTYNDADGEPVEYIVWVYVKHELWDVTVHSGNGLGKATPGMELDLIATVDHRTYDKNTGTITKDDNLQVNYVWDGDADFDDYFTLRCDETDCSYCTVIPKKDLKLKSDKTGTVTVIVGIPDKKGGMKEVDRCYYVVTATQKYISIEPADFPKQELKVNSSADLTPELIKYAADADPAAVTQNVRFRWSSWDADAVEITDSTGKVLTTESNEARCGTAPFTIRFLKAGETKLELTAEIAEGNGTYREVSRRTWALSISEAEE